MLVSASRRVDGLVSPRLSFSPPVPKSSHLSVPQLHHYTSQKDEEASGEGETGKDVQHVPCGTGQYRARQGSYSVAARAVDLDSRDVHGSPS